MSSGVASYVSDPAEGIADTIRLWPHHLKGEGHYLAVLRKEGSLKGCNPEAAGKARAETGFPAKSRKRNGLENPEFTAFAEETLCGEVWENLPEKGEYLRFGEQLYLAPTGIPSLQGLRILRPGLHLGTLKKNRFQPSHALALALKPHQVIRTVNLSGDGREIAAYLNGQTFPCEGERAGI